MCRQAAYRSRAMAAADDRDLLAELAVRLRDNADRLWLISQGWTPPSGPTDSALNALLTETVAVAEELARWRQTLGDETGDDWPPASPT